MIYSLIKVFFRFVLKIYFNKIELVGLENVPKGHPMIVAPNHQNAFLDAFLVGAFFPIPLHFLARQDVFNWWSKPLLRIVNMMPVYRIRDGYSKLSENDAVFETCKALFKENKSILMFPEGNHGEHHFLRPLTKGAARLALQSQADMGNELMLLPVGLNYFDHRRPVSKVIIAFGQPIPVSEFIAHYEENHAQGLIQLRDQLSMQMKETLLIPEETEQYELQKRSIFRSANERRSFNELRNLPLDSDIPEQAKSSRHLLAKILNPIPFLIIWKVLTGVKDVVFHSSLKFAVGLFVFPIWWVSCFFSFNALFGTIPALIIISMSIFSIIISYKSDNFNLKRDWAFWTI